MRWEASEEFSIVGVVTPSYLCRAWTGILNHCGTGLMGINTLGNT